jgi:hypothetical protein
LRDVDEKADTELVAEAATALDDCQSIMPAQFSMAPVADAVRAMARCPMLTSPDAAVVRLKALLA